MGLIKKELARVTLPDREAHNSRMFIDLCENIHIHYREFRIVFTLDEYFEFADILERSTEDVRSYLAQNPDFEEGKYPTTIMIAGGKERQRQLLKNSPAPNKSTYFAEDFAIELNDESVVDEMHVHWRDYRFALPRSHFRAIAEAFAKAKAELDAFEATNTYQRKPHRDRSMEDFAKERAKFDNHVTRIAGEVDIPVSDVRTRYDKADSDFEPASDDLQFLARLYRENRLITPIVLSTERDGTHHIIDGNHRVAAAKEAGLTHINAVVTDLTFAESELFRRAEGLLKRFDRQTKFRYNTSGFNRQFFAYRASRYYTDHFHRLSTARTDLKRFKHNLRRRRIRLRESFRRIRRWFNAV
jgi:hypothetical protein